LSFGALAFPPSAEASRVAETAICSWYIRLGMNAKGRTYTYVVNNAEEGGYTAKCMELPHVHTEGETLAEVKKNMRDALTLAIDYIREKASREKGEVLEITIR
jgi:predicted RNase H-like HicB family nuclease